MTTTAPRLIDDLRAAFDAPDPTSMERLHDALVERAERDRLLDIAYRTIDSPLGPLLLAATPEGLVRVAFEREGHDDVLVRLAGAISPRILRTPRRLDPVAKQLDEYFGGRRRSFDVPVDLQLAGGFRRQVLEHLRAIPYGDTESYAAAAAAAGNPRAVRAAASACSHNPVPLVVPCHRVVRSDGSYGQYLGGEAAKRALLEMEAAV
jgi:methylated-DNA-[protein]-cysteine S-methyltransferase